MAVFILRYMMTFEIFIVILVFLSCLESDAALKSKSSHNNNASEAESGGNNLSKNDGCAGLNPDNIISIFTTPNIPDPLPPVTSRHCFCKNEGGNQEKTLGKTCWPKCFPCDKDEVRCKGYGNCCSRGLEELTGNSTYKSKPVVVCSSDSIKKKKYLLVASCPVEYDDVITKALCEDQLPWDEVTIETASVVTDNETGVTFLNHYCAKCNNVKEVNSYKGGIYQPDQ